MLQASTPNKDLKSERKEALQHLAASLTQAKVSEQGAVLLVGAGISVSAGIPPANELIKAAIQKFPDFFNDAEKLHPEKLQYNEVMKRLSNVLRKELFKPYIENAKLNFAHIAIAELLKQGYISRILTVNFDPLLIHACYMVGMYPFPAIYDLGAVSNLNAELLNDPCIVYLNGQHVGFVQRNTTDQLQAHEEILSQIVRSTGCTKPWIVAGYSGENDPLMKALAKLRPYNNWLYWLQRGSQLRKDNLNNTIESHQFLEQDEECKVIFNCNADNTFLEIADLLDCSLDFIERPEKELERYLQEINFETANSKEYFFEQKVKNYIAFLREPYIVNFFQKHDLIQKKFAQASNLFATSLDQNSKKLSYEALQEILKIHNEILLIDPKEARTLFAKGFALCIYLETCPSNTKNQTLNQAKKCFIDNSKAGDLRGFTWLAYLYLNNDDAQNAISILEDLIQQVGKSQAKKSIDRHPFIEFSTHPLLLNWYKTNFQG